MLQVKIGAVKLKLVPEDGRYPEHLTWKQALERDWAGPWGTLARLTAYRFHLALDPSFYYERPEYRRGQLHHYEWILCRNGGLISLYSSQRQLGQVWTSKALGEKILTAVPGARVFRTSEEFLYCEIHFPLDQIHQVCQLAGARRSRKRKAVSEAEKERLRQIGFGSARPLPATVQERPAAR
jgi:hypothetical protein